jgi:nitrous oxidase accessory protein NosD
MSRTILTCFWLVALLALRLPNAFAQEGSGTSELLVNKADGPCPNAGFQSIQDAVDAAHAGDTIRVCAGEYQEQVVVRNPVKLLADNGAVLTPRYMVRNASSLLTGEPLSVAILVSSTEGAMVTGFALDLRNNGLTGCPARLIGILYQNASGEIASNSIRNVKFDSPLAGCETGSAIEVQSGNGGHSEVEIHDNQVANYQSNGITANGEGTVVGIDENEITSGALTERDAQNGIQVGFGARGIIENNTIASDMTNDLSLSRCASNAVGILVFASDGVVVDANSIESSNAGIFVEGNYAKISGNNFSKCTPVIGIALLGNENEVTDNELPGGGQAAIFILGRKNVVQRNQLAASAFGIFKVLDSWHNMVSDDAFNVAYVPIQESSPLAIPVPTPSR